MAMALSLEGLRNLPEEELIRRHNEKALNTTVGVDYYLKEIERRDRERAIKSQDEATMVLIRYTNQLRILTIVLVFLTLAIVALTVVLVLKEFAFI